MELTDEWRDYLTTMIKEDSLFRDTAERMVSNTLKVFGLPPALIAPAPNGSTAIEAKRILMAIVLEPFCPRCKAVCQN